MTERGLLRSGLRVRLLLPFFLFFLMYNSAGGYQIDSTKVRPRQEVKRSFGQKLIKVPQYVLYSPFWLVEKSADFSVNQIILSRSARRFFSLFKRVDRVWGFYPAVGYGSNPGLIGGLVFTSANVLTKGERLRIKGTYSTHDYQRYYIRYTLPRKFKPLYDTRLRVEYHKKPYESFYGLGGGSRLQDEVAFTLEEGFIDGGFSIFLSPRSKLGFEGSYKFMNLFGGEDPDVEGDLDLIKSELNLVEADLRPMRFWSAGVSLARDWRDNPAQPSHGGFEQVAVSYFHGVGCSRDVEFLIGRLDLQHFFDLYKKRIVAVRFSVEGIGRPGNSSLVPFYLKPSLGGEDNLRGFSTRRFVDNSWALVTIEYRYPVYSGADMFIFLDEGRVFESLQDDFSFRNWRYSAGLGLRLWNRDGMILMTQVAFSDEDSRFYLQLSI